MFWIIPISFLVVFEIVADVFSVKYARYGGKLYWILAISMFVVANIFWLWGIRSGSGLARGAVIFSVASATFAAILGVFFFGEHLKGIQLIGIALGVISLVCILYP